MEVAVCLFTWFGLILPFKQDALSGIKEQVSFNIAIKEHYPITGQYFFRFRHKIDQLHEVDEARYNQYDEGSDIFIDRAIKSGFVFSAGNHVKSKFFDLTIKRRNLRP